MSLAHAGQVGSRALAAVVQTGWLFPLCALLALVGVCVAWLVRFLIRQRQRTLVFSERARMAREIHDTLLQSLVGVELQLDAIQERPEEAVDAIRCQLVRLRNQVADAIRETRLSIWNLRLPDLAADGLPGSLRRAGDALTLGSQVKFDLSVSGAPRSVDPYVGEQLLRIAQEAVSNAVRHASATVVCVSLCYSDDSVSLRVSDDGCGFDASRLRTDGVHWGLKGMEERALYEAGHPSGFRSAPGGQLVQEADVFAPVRGARIVLWDDQAARADMTASWLAQMAWEVYVLDAVFALADLETGPWRPRQFRALGATEASPSGQRRYKRPYEGTDNPRGAMQAYLDWEYGLVAQLERDGTHGFFVI